MEPGLRNRLVLLAVLLGIGGAAGLRSWRAVARAHDVERTCDLVETDAAGAVATSDALIADLAEGDPLLPVAVDCRCAALARVGDAAACATLVDETLDRAGDDWLEPDVFQRLLGVLVTTDRDPTTQRLLGVAAGRFPLEPGVLSLWFVVLARSADPATVVSTLRPHIARLPPDDSVELRIALGTLLADRDVDAALTALDPAPPGDHPRRDDWYLRRANIYGRADRQLDVVRTMEAWEAAGADRRHVFLNYAILLSVNHLDDAQKPADELLRAAIDQAPPDTDPAILAVAYGRLVMFHANRGAPEKALALAAEAERRGVTLHAEQLAEISRDVGAPAAGATLRLTVRVPSPAPGDEVLFVPGDPTRPDAPPARVPVPPSGEVTWTTTYLERALRWVARDAAGHVLGSGTAVAGADGAPIVAAIEARAPVAPPAPADLSARPPADGHRQVFVVIADCADWHLVRYLGARGDLPWMSALEGAGVAGVLRSEPAFTGVAMEKIAHPEINPGVTVARYVHELGVEMQGLESVGVNPLAPLAWVLPDTPYLVDVLGAGDVRALNLLFSHGDIDAGRNAEIVGPRGARREISLTMRRELRPEEQDAALRGTTLSPTGARYLQEMAAELDAAIFHVAAGDVDLMLLRVEQTDLLTHGTYAEVNRTAQDGGHGDLFSAYRYVDHRVGELVRAADADDVVIVMSDHGIENSLVHSPEAYFTVHGLGGGRLTDSPEIAGLPRLLVALLGVDPDPRWPETTLEAQVLGSGTAER